MKVFGDLKDIGNRLAGMEVRDFCTSKKYSKTVF